MSEMTLSRVKALQDFINQEISKINYPDSPQSLYQPIRYMMDLGGKRLRPVLVMMAYELFGKKGEEAVEEALAIEIFHNFTLVHDDIMDNAPIRRGKQTVFKKWNSSTAILAGDIMMIHATQHLANGKREHFSEILKMFNDTAIQVCEGQQIDMDFENRDNVSVSEYLKMIELKTAVLLGGSLYIGARAAGANINDAQSLYDFGRHIGVAFQLQDDILDVFGGEEFGKQAGGDIIANKKTYLLIQALNTVDPSQLETLNKWLSYSGEHPEDKVAAVTRIYEEGGIREMAEKEMKRFYEKALSFLNSVKADKDKKDQLAALANSLMYRSK